MDIQATRVKVEIPPSQRQRLANAKARGREQHQQRMEALTRGLIQETFYAKELVTVFGTANELGQVGGRGTRNHPATTTVEVAAATATGKRDR